MIFVADHQGLITEKSEVLRPFQVGRVLDDLEEGTYPSASAILTRDAYADLRQYYYARHMVEEPHEYVALLQYRRMFYFPPPAGTGGPELASLDRGRGSSKSQDTFRVAEKLRAPYLARLASLKPADLKAALAGHRFVVNERSFPTSVSQQYIEGVMELHSGESAYVEAWHDMAGLLKRRLPAATVAAHFEGQSGYFHNCLVAARADFWDYADFLFDLFADMPAYAEVPRVYGYLAERVLAPYLAARGLSARSTAILLFA